MTDSRRTITVPVVGYFAKAEETRTIPLVDWNEYPHHEELGGIPLKTVATREIDRIACGCDRQSSHIAMVWLELKGYVKRVALRRDHPFFSDWVYEMTDSGRAFHAQNAAPIGEW